MGVPDLPVRMDRGQLVLQHSPAALPQGIAARSRYFAVAPFYFNFRNHEAKTHRFALFPLYWDFKNFAKQKQRRVLFPLYWEFQNGRKTHGPSGRLPLLLGLRDAKARERDTMAVFPFYTRWVRGETTARWCSTPTTRRSASPQGVRWQYHFFPFFSRGGIDDDRWWNVFYGLAGYDRRGEHRRGKAFWIPFKLN